MIKEHDRIVLTQSLPSSNLEMGDVGTIIHIYEEKKVSEVEFLSLDGSTSLVATIANSHLRPVTKNDFTHAREMAKN